jgi:hypothetical protein
MLLSSTKAQGAQAATEQNSLHWLLWGSVTAFVVFGCGILARRRAEKKRRKRQAQLLHEQADIERTETGRKRREGFAGQLRLARDAARRIAVNIAKLPELLKSRLCRRLPPLRARCPQRRGPRGNGRGPSHHHPPQQDGPGGARSHHRHSAGDDRLPSGRPEGVA